MGLKKLLEEEIKEGDLALFLKISPEKKEAFYGRVANEQDELYLFTEENYNKERIILSPAIHLIPPELVGPGVYNPKANLVQRVTLRADPNIWEIYLNEEIPSACESSWLKDTYGPLIKAGVYSEIKKAKQQNQIEFNFI